jgi:hypothetical protein
MAKTMAVILGKWVEIRVAKKDVLAQHRKADRPE